MTTEKTAVIEHQPQLQRFVLPMGDVMAIVEYERAGATVNFTHTWVPPELRGGGHAQSLVSHALNWAKNDGLTVSATCWYVQKFL